MSLLPEIERELMRAARGLSTADGADDVGSPGQRRGRARRARELAFTASLVAAAAVIAVALLVTLHHGGPPQRAASPGSNTLFPDAPHTQSGDWARQRRDVTCPLASRNPYLSRDVGCVSVSRGDVEGTGHPDLVLVFAQLGQRVSDTRYRPSYFELMVVRPHHQGLVGEVLLSARSLPRIVSIANVDDRSGDEIFVQFGNGTVRVYTIDGRHLVRAGLAVLVVRQRLGVLDDYSCEVGSRPSITEQRFHRGGGSTGSSWYRTDTTYSWQEARLVRIGGRTVPVTGPPVRVSRTGC